MMDKIPVWIDTDPGVDDALAILAALKEERLEIAGISAVAGNTGLENTYRNARNILAFAHREDIPVYAGSAKPLFRELVTAPSAHGNDGLCGAVLPESTVPYTEMCAFDALYACAKKYAGELRLAAVGPLTNIALAFKKYPDLPGLLKEILIMGGAAEKGNITPCAEFNVYVDPHAAEAVFRCGKIVKMFGLDVTAKAYLTEEECAELSEGTTGFARFFRDSTQNIIRLKETMKNYELCMHDACPLVYLVHPEFFEGEECTVHVETEGRITLGKTVTDLWSDQSFHEPHNAKVMLGVDREKFTEYLKRKFAEY